MIPSVLLALLPEAALAMAAVISGQQPVTLGLTSTTLAATSSDALPRADLTWALNASCCSNDPPIVHPELLLAPLLNCRPVSFSNLLKRLHVKVKVLGSLAFETQGGINQCVQISAAHPTD